MSREFRKSVWKNFRHICTRSVEYLSILARRKPGKRFIIQGELWVSSYRPQRVCASAVLLSRCFPPSADWLQTCPHLTQAVLWFQGLGDGWEVWTSEEKHLLLHDPSQHIYDTLKKEACEESHTILCFRFTFIFFLCGAFTVSPPGLVKTSPRSEAKVEQRVRIVWSGCGDTETKPQAFSQRIL